MARIIVDGERPFRVGASSFCIAATTAGYTLNYSADGEHFTPWSESTAADVDQVVINAANGMYFKLEDNSDDGVAVTW